VSLYIKNLTASDKMAFAKLVKYYQPLKTGISNEVTLKSKIVQTIYSIHCSLNDHILYDLQLKAG
jgi:hypothetical protein